MAGRAAQRALETPPGQPARVDCDNCAAEPSMVRIGGKNLCLACEQRVRLAEAREFCKSKGLDTVEKQRDYCRRLARSFGHRPTAGGFQRWADTITQHTVDWMLRMGTKSDEQAIERLRAAGAIDGRNRVIPKEARAVAADAYRAERARQIAKVQEELAELARRYPAAEPTAEDEGTGA